MRKKNLLISGSLISLGIGAIALSVGISSSINTNNFNVSYVNTTNQVLENQNNLSLQTSSSNANVIEVNLNDFSEAVEKNYNIMDFYASCDQQLDAIKNNVASMINDYVPQNQISNTVYGYDIVSVTPDFNLATLTVQLDQSKFSNLNVVKFTNFNTQQVVPTNVSQSYNGQFQTNRIVVNLHHPNWDLNDQKSWTLQTNNNNDNKQTTIDLNVYKYIMDTIVSSLYTNPPPTWISVPYYNLENLYIVQDISAIENTNFGNQRIYTYDTSSTDLNQNYENLSRAISYSILNAKANNTLKYGYIDVSFYLKEYVAYEKNTDIVKMFPLDKNTLYTSFSQRKDNLRIDIRLTGFYAQGVLEKTQIANNESTAIAVGAGVGGGIGAVGIGIGGFALARIYSKRYFRKK